MDFILDLVVYGNSVLLVYVDKFSKFCQLILMGKREFNAKQVS